MLHAVLPRPRRPQRPGTDRSLVGREEAASAEPARQPATERAPTRSLAAAVLVTLFGHSTLSRLGHVDAEEILQRTP